MLYYTHLHNAILENNIEKLQLLMQEEAYSNLKDNYSVKLLHTAAIFQKCNKKILKTLLNHGINVNSEDRNGRTPLHMAVQVRNNIENVKVLLERGASVNAKDNNDFSSLHLASGEEYNSEILELLLDYGADINSKNIYNQTALCYAILQGSKSNVITLLNLGVNIDCSSIIDLFNKRPYMRTINTALDHLIKMKMFNLIDEKSFATWRTKVIPRPTLEQFEVACKVEAEKICKIKICENRITTFADVLLKSLDALAILLNVEDVQKALREINLKKQFPIYSDMLKFRIEKGINLAGMLKRSCETLNTWMKNDQIPVIVAEQIVSYLNKKDLRHLSETWI